MSRHTCPCSSLCTSQFSSPLYFVFSLFYFLHIWVLASNESNLAFHELFNGLRVRLKRSHYEMAISWWGMLSIYYGWVRLFMQKQMDKNNAKTARRVQCAVGLSRSDNSAITWIIDRIIEKQKNDNNICAYP